MLIADGASSRRAASRFDRWAQNVLLLTKACQYHARSSPRWRRRRHAAPPPPHACRPRFFIALSRDFADWLRRISASEYAGLVLLCYFHFISKIIDYLWRFLRAIYWMIISITLHSLHAFEHDCMLYRQLMIATTYHHFILFPFTISRRIE